MRPHPLILTTVTLAGLAGVAALALRGCLGPPLAPPATADGLPPVPVVDAERRARFVGSQACAECHSAAHAEHSRTTHARTLQRIDEADLSDVFSTRQELQDTQRRATYSFGLQQGKPVAQVRVPGMAQPVEASPNYVLGSGKIGYTFIYDRDGQFTESRTSYYPPMKRWTWTPGHQVSQPLDVPWGRPMSADRTTQCFLCHSTAVVRDGDLVRAEQSLFNVGCERCHGPGSDHIDAARRGQGLRAIYTYRNASSKTVMALCAECHRSPAPIPEDAKFAALALPRFASAALPLSECFKQSGGKLTCLSCHRPHEPLSTDAARYDRTCRSCHGPERSGSSVCPVNQVSGCVNCHMPAQPTVFPIDRKFRMHWIKVWEAEKASRTASR